MQGFDVMGTDAAPAPSPSRTRSWRPWRSTPTDDPVHLQEHEHEPPTPQPSQPLSSGAAGNGAEAWADMLPDVESFFEW